MTAEVHEVADVTASAEAGGPDSRVPRVGPEAGAEALSSWVESAAAGGLPSPTRARWQPLRAGVVNLWEFGADEYWFADGRAQLSGRNQSGKSTLMALTTLILLTGSLERRNLDTFGKDQKSFRYYVEPTNGDDDRRESSAGAHRGWAWVEYGRLTAEGPQFFTCLLYAEARRGSQGFPRRWLTVRGSRVRAELRLHTGNAVTPAKDVDDVPGVRIHPDGHAYADTIARELFGFPDPDRLATLTAMLRVLRQPHLGQQLNPDSFTQQMRTALPEVDPAEVAQLADGWEQLDRLAEDRDAAENARRAVDSFVKRHYNPWADAVLRSRGDALTSANTSFDKVTRDLTQARRTLEEATGQLEALERSIGELGRAKEEAVTAHQHLSESAEVKEVRARAARVEELARAETRAREVHARWAELLSKARQAAVDAGSRLRSALEAEAAARLAVEEHAALLRGLLVETGLPAESEAWLGDGDVTRLRTAIGERQARLEVLEGLLRRHDAATEALERAVASRTRLHSAHETALAAAQGAQAAWDGQAQAVSDAVEAWAVTVGERLGSHPDRDIDPDGVAPQPPDGQQRRAWVDAAIGSAAAGGRALRLRADIAGAWRDPALERIRGARAGHEARALDGEVRARALEAEAEALLAQPQLVPPQPTDWTRRDRPEAGAGGAPLWMLLDPVDGAPVDVLEATLAAAGVLDAWVSPDGRWVGDRDGDDVVLTTADLASAGHVPTLAAWCRVDDAAGQLAPHAHAVLAGVAVVEAGAELPTHVPVAISLDGRWRTAHASGRAGVAAHGAAFLGAAARAAARARRVQELRDAAAAQREAAGRERELAEANQQLAGFVTDLADAAPDDQALVDAAHASAQARAASAAAEQRWRDAEVEAQRASTAADEAHTALVRHATDHRLPVTEEAARDVRRGLDRLRDGLGGLEGRLSSCRAAVVAGEQAQERCDEADLALQDAQASHDAADAELARARTAHRTEREAVSRDDRELLDQVKALEARARTAGRELEAAKDRRAPLAVALNTAQNVLVAAEQSRAQAERERRSALEAFLVPVRAGLAAARGLEAPDDERITAALELARRARATLQPRQWPDDQRERERRVVHLWNGVTKQVAETRVQLEAAGGRSLAIELPGEGEGPDDDGGAGSEVVGSVAGGTDVAAVESDQLPAVVVTVDSGGAALTPWQAQARLRDQVEELTSEHDSKLSEVLTDLLASTFLDHLRKRARKVDDLIAGINKVLEAHPTGATQVVLRLRTQAPDLQKDAYDVVTALTRQFLDEPAVQARIRDFLHGQVRQAQEQARARGEDWKQRLAELLDYRAWFDVVVDRKVKGGAWQPLTRAAHDVDSGGGKAVTLLQPLLATLVALYDEADGAPRPVWLDEAFAGIDDANRVQVLRLFREFDLDFLFAGPGTLVAAPVVPAVAIWSVNRAPAPHAGVDLSLTLWTGSDRTATAVDTDFSANLPSARPSVADADDALLLDFGS